MDDLTLIAVALVANTSAIVFLHARLVRLEKPRRTEPRDTQ